MRIPFLRGPLPVALGTIRFEVAARLVLSGRMRTWLLSGPTVIDMAHSFTGTENG